MSESISSVFVIGATGFVGSGVARALIQSGYRVSGLARSVESVNALKAAGVEPISGTLANTQELASITSEFDACVFAPMIPYEDEGAVVNVILDTYKRSGKTFIFTSGTGVLAVPTSGGDWNETSFAEDDHFDPPPWLTMRVLVENQVRAAAAQGTRTFVIRPPMVWGHGGGKQIPCFFESVRATGDACYFGAGLNMYSNVHIDDLSRVYCLALERGTPGALYHAVGSEVNFRSFAEAVADVRKCNTRSVNYTEACSIWGEFTVKFGFSVNSRSRAVRTRAELDWKPEQLDPIADIRFGSYRTVAAFNS